MVEFNKVVARFTDGVMVKGTTQDFHPNRSHFRVQPVDDGPAVELELKRLKALFFVRDLAGDSRRQHIPGFIAAPGDNIHGKKIAVQFKDGELLCGYALGFSRDREGFFVFPADHESNNVRVYVLTSATDKITVGPMAEATAKKALGDRAA